ncbi:MULTISPECIES: hypothetical protein [unclassified Lentimicrobium]|uniref:hypothetical protein n=1 Tax=unclassified Lentimicrobium TaxID=2677434 RepID=UPI00155490F1|nr:MULTISPECIES: hypothetical protein [unclassified Lentimicrobium]NPD45525.1 hypothetical protein [Lentimicrobium sp. S6]NPD84035.1 hypothetical protein [Lentimicrobium sp. L6]
MKKFNFIILNILFVLSLFGQEHNSDCKYDGVSFKIGSNSNILQSLDSIYELDIDRDALFKYTECLLGKFPSNPEINWFYALNCLRWNGADTSQSYYLRKCIKAQYELGQSYAGIGINYLDYIDDNDSIGLSSLTASDKERIIKYGEYNLWKAIDLGFRYSYFELARAQDLREELELPFLKSFNKDSDTIIFVAFIRDCGEFGGHKEEIRIMKGDSGYMATYSAGEVKCWVNIKISSELPDYQKYEGKSQRVSKEDYNILISEVINYKARCHWMTNAPFKIAIFDGQRVIKKEIHCHPWNYYLDLRMETFGF